MSELFIVVALHARRGKEDALRQDLIAVVGPSRNEEGSLGYDLFIDREDPGRFVFVEHWASAEAHQRHHTQSAQVRHCDEHGSANVEKVEFVHMLDRIA